MLQRYIISLALLVLFLLEGTIMEWVIPPVWQSQVLVVPHLVLVGVLLISLFKNRYHAFVYGLVFGLLQDFIYYGHALGVYSFSMALAGYCSGLVFRSKSPGIVLSLLAGAIGSLGYDALIYGIYRLFLGVIKLHFEWAFMHQMLPSMLFNMLIMLLLYMPARKWLEDDDTNAEPEPK